LYTHVNEPLALQNTAHSRPKELLLTCRQDFLLYSYMASQGRNKGSSSDKVHWHRISTIRQSLNML